MFYNPMEGKILTKEIICAIAGNNPNTKNLNENHTYSEVRKILSRPNHKKDTTHIFVGSNKGGVGKSAFSIQLSWYLNARGHSVLLVDADAQANTTCSLLADESKIEADMCLFDLLTGSAKIEDIIFSVTDGLDIMGANSSLSEIDHYLRSHESTEVNNYFERDMRKSNSSNDIYLKAYNLFKSIGENYDYVIYDTNPETNRFNRLSMQVCDIAIIPMQPKESSAKAFSVTLAEIHDSFITVGRDVSNITDKVKLLFNNISYIPENKKEAIIKKIYQHFSGSILSDYIDYSFELGEASDVGWPAFIHSEISINTIMNISGVVDEIIKLIDEVKGEKNSKKRRHMFLSSNA